MFCKEIVKKNAAEAGVLEEINITFLLGDFFSRFGCSIVNIGTLVLICFDLTLNLANIQLLHNQWNNKVHLIPFHRSKIGCLLLCYILN